MGALVLILVEDQWQDLWMHRVGGLTVLGRALLGLSEAGAVVGLIAGADVGTEALAGREPKQPIRMFAAGTATDAAQKEISPGAAALVIAQPFVCDRVTAKRLAQGEPGVTLPFLKYEIEAQLAEDSLLAGTRKPILADGFVSVLVLRPLSRAVTKLLINSAVTPNQVTIIAMLLGLLSGVLAADGGYAANIWAVLALLAGAVADCVDGELARLRHQGSKLGEWLDSLADDISTGCFLVGLSFGQTWLPFGLDPLWFGLGCVTIFLVMSIYMYHTLSKYVGVLDTAQFPYFFMGSRTPDPDAPVGIADIVGLIFRRDFLIALALLFAVLNISWLSLLIIGAGLCVTAVAVLLTAIIRPPHRHARTGQS